MSVEVLFVYQEYLPVSLSNFSENAIAKKNSWYPIVIRRVMAR
mgnify:CR=1 FL=1